MSTETWESDASKMETLVEEYVDRGLLDDETAVEVERLVRRGFRREALELAIERTRGR